MTKKKVEDEAFAMLTREATIRDMVPEYAENKIKKGVAILFAELSGDKPLDILRSFSDCVFSGATPPPNVLVFIAECLTSYFDNEGKITLDKAFNLQSRQRIGHPLKDQQAKHKRGRILYYMWQLRKQAETENRTLSIFKAAGETINTLGLTDVSEYSLEKSYTEIDADEIFDNLFNEMLEFQRTVK
ncbi:hypothetical protein KFZ76_05720 [Methylovulum psychrotolerans]|uniref:hypothetical protein n=1 Tax=Methylovulum psychrotolerans TaxID=1704499 RepID=UPI001BFFAEFE|nr:hypothetical protein [Methylovulum psychrotolerans]MBT9097206.1 hypothetical protein [Methylovulum psychrotolerans]